jgi:hypothetical protein
MKELIVIVGIATIIFRLARPVALRFMSEDDFARRRMVWFVLTVVGSLSPSFWLYVLVAIPLLISTNRKESNPVAFYLLLLHVVPQVSIPIPVLGNNGLFPLDNYRLLAFCVLLPGAIRFVKDPDREKSSPSGAIEALFLLFGVLQVVLYVAPDLPEHYLMPDSASNFLRRALLYCLDVYLVYFVVSRTCQSRTKIIDAAACFCLACAVMAGVAMFEELRHWLLYVPIASRWGTDPNASVYLMRGNQLRAQASAGHALALGYLLAVASGFWLYLKTQVSSRAYRLGFTALLWGGLYATGSRGPWMGTIIIYFAFKAAGPRAFSRVVKGGILAGAIAGGILASPIGEKILSVLPIFGRTVDFNILYRQRLAARGWDIVFAHPFFGDQFPWPELEDLRQGEGIIDLVNTYLSTSLFYGLVGLFCFLGVMLIGTTKAYVRAKELARSDPNVSLFGTSIVACVAGTLVMIQSSSFSLGLEKMFYVLAGLAIAYARLGAPPVVPSAVLPQPQLGKR